MDLVQLLYSVPSLGIDESKGPPSFLFVTHQIVLESFPYKFPDTSGFFISNCWLGSPGSHRQQIVIYKPGGDVLVDTTERPFQLEDSEIPYTAITFFQGLEFLSPGVYSICVSLDGELVCEYPLHLRQENREE